MNGYRTRNYPINLTPWYRNAAGDLSGITLPAGYRLHGSAIRATGPYQLELYRGATRIAVYDITDAKDCRDWLLIGVNLAYIDQEETEGI